MKLTIAAALCASSVALAADAPVVKDNPIGAQYLATMPAAGDAGVYAQFAVMSGPSGEGVSFAININGKTFENGPFREYLPTPLSFLRVAILSSVIRGATNRTLNERISNSSRSLPHSRTCGSLRWKLHRNRRSS